MYTTKSYYEIPLIRLLTFVVLAHSVKETTYIVGFFIAMANDHEIT